MIALQPTTLNHRLATPNKLFESLAAGVPVVASRFPEMERIVAEWQVGELCDPTRIAAIAEATARILRLPADDYVALRRRCRRATLERFNWETEVRALLGVYARLAPTGEAP
jgi:glycosyltransferase involved in cell wall biosynthesis